MKTKYNYMRTKASPKYLAIIFLQCLTAATLFSQELIRNGHFSMGNTGFTSQHFYCNTKGCLYPTGGYALGTNPDYFNPAFVGKDHTTGTGNFMIINGSETGNKVWKETVQVNANTEYKLAAWVSSMVTQFPAKLNFLINGVSIGKKLAPSLQNQWEVFGATWNSGAVTSATIAIVDLNTTAAGNDFGLDDISFKAGTTIVPATTASSGDSSLNTSRVSSAVLLIYPNPSTGRITLKYSANSTGRAELTVNDLISGRTIYIQPSQITKGINTCYLNLSNLKSGMYYLQIGTINRKERIKFTIQK
jgi:hypothetical protein